MAQGTIVQSIGAVIDIKFPREGMPNIYDALVLEETADNPLGHWPSVTVSTPLVIDAMRQRRTVLTARVREASELIEGAYALLYGPMTGRNPPPEQP